MPTNARMTFRFEPIPATKPVKPVQSPGQAKRDSTGDAVERLLIVPKPAPAGERSSESAYNHTVMDTAPTKSGPLQDDIRTLEEMIRRTDSEIVLLPPAQPETSLPAKADRKVTALQERRPIVVRELEQTELDHERPERWTLPEDDGEYKPTGEWLSQVGAYTRNDGPTWTRVLLSVTAAIATGALFGYMVLSLFTGEPMFPSKQADGNVKTAVQTQASDSPSSATVLSRDGAANEGTTSQSGQNKPDARAALAEIPAGETFVLQYGVFRNADSTQLAAEQLKDVGLPAAIDDSDGYRVYAGIAPTKAEAELLAAQMPNIEVYIKPMDGATLKLSPNSNTETLKAFLTASAALRQLIAQLSVGALQDALPQPLAQEDADALQQAAASWKASQPAEGALTGTAATAALNLEQSLDAALASFASYAKKTSRFHLWSAQTAILQAELADRDLCDALQSAAHS